MLSPIYELLSCNDYFRVTMYEGTMRKTAFIQAIPFSMINVTLISKENNEKHLGALDLRQPLSSHCHWKAPPESYLKLACLPVPAQRVTAVLREVGAVVCMAVGLLELEAVLGFLGCCLSVYFSVLALLLQSLHSFQTHSEKVNVQVLVRNAL